MDNRKITANILNGLSIISMITAVAGSLVNFFENYDIPLKFGLFFIVSVVLVIAVRVIFPENKLGKILIRIYIALVLCAVGFFACVIISCYMAADSCIDSCCSTAEDCGRIG